MSDLAKYTTFKVRKELGDLADLLLERHRDVLAVYGMDNRSGFISYVLIELAKHQGLIDSVDPELRAVYDRVF